MWGTEAPPGVCFRFWHDGSCRNESACPYCHIRASTAAGNNSSALRTEAGDVPAVAACDDGSQVSSSARLGVCSTFWESGTCHWGAKCRFEHRRPTLTDGVARQKCQVSALKAAGDNSSTVSAGAGATASGARDKSHVGNDRSEALSSVAAGPPRARAPSTQMRLGVCSTFWESGTCHWGAKCRFEHSRQAPKAEITWLECHGDKKEAGVTAGESDKSHACDDGSEALSSVAAGPPRARAPSTQMRLGVCSTFWESGTCHWGAKCRFEHSRQAPTADVARQEAGAEVTGAGGGQERCRIDSGDGGRLGKRHKGGHLSLSWCYHVSPLDLAHARLEAEELEQGVSKLMCLTRYYVKARVPGEHVEWLRELVQDVQGVTGYAAGQSLLVARCLLRELIVSAQAHVSVAEVEVQGQAGKGGNSGQGRRVCDDVRCWQVLRLLHAVKLTSISSLLKRASFVVCNTSYNLAEHWRRLCGQRGMSFEHEQQPEAARSSASSTSAATAPAPPPDSCSAAGCGGRRGRIEVLLGELSSVPRALPGGCGMTGGGGGSGSGGGGDGGGAGDDGAKGGGERQGAAQDELALLYLADATGSIGVELPHGLRATALADKLLLSSTFNLVRLASPPAVRASSKPVRGEEAARDDTCHLELSEATAVAASRVPHYSLPLPEHLPHLPVLHPTEHDGGNKGRVNLAGRVLSVSPLICALKPDGAAVHYFLVELGSVACQPSPCSSPCLHMRAGAKGGIGEEALLLDLSVARSGLVVMQGREAMRWLSFFQMQACVVVTSLRRAKLDHTLSCWKAMPEHTKVAPLDGDLLLAMQARPTGSPALALPSLEADDRGLCSGAGDDKPRLQALADEDQTGEGQGAKRYQGQGGGGGGGLKQGGGRGVVDYQGVITRVFATQHGVLELDGCISVLTCHMADHTRGRALRPGAHVTVYNAVPLLVNRKLVALACGTFSKVDVLAFSLRDGEMGSEAMRGANAQAVSAAVSAAELTRWRHVFDKTSFHDYFRILVLFRQLEAKFGSWCTEQVLLAGWSHALTAPSSLGSRCQQALCCCNKSIGLIARVLNAALPEPTEPLLRTHPATPEPLAEPPRQPGERALRQQGPWGSIVCDCCNSATSCQVAGGPSVLPVKRSLKHEFVEFVRARRTMVHASILPCASFVLPTIQQLLDALLRFRRHRSATVRQPRHVVGKPGASKSIQGENLVSSDELLPFILEMVGRGGVDFHRGNTGAGEIGPEQLEIDEQAFSGHSVPDSRTHVMLMGILQSRGARIVLSDDTGHIGVVVSHDHLWNCCGTCEPVGMTDVVLLSQWTVVVPSDDTLVDSQSLSSMHTESTKETQPSWDRPILQVSGDGNNLSDRPQHGTYQLEEQASHARISTNDGGSTGRAAKKAVSGLRCLLRRRPNLPVLEAFKAIQCDSKHKLPSRIHHLTNEEKHIALHKALARERAYLIKVSHLHPPSPKSTDDKLTCTLYGWVWMERDHKATMIGPDAAKNLFINQWVQAKIVLRESSALFFPFIDTGRYYVLTEAFLHKQPPDTLQARDSKELVFCLDSGRLFPLNDDALISFQTHEGTFLNDKDMAGLQDCEDFNCVGDLQASPKPKHPWCSSPGSREGKKRRICRAMQQDQSNCYSQNDTVDELNCDSCENGELAAQSGKHQNDKDVQCGTRNIDGYVTGEEKSLEQILKVALEAETEQVYSFRGILVSKRWCYALGERAGVTGIRCGRQNADTQRVSHGALDILRKTTLELTLKEFSERVTCNQALSVRLYLDSLTTWIPCGLTPGAVVYLGRAILCPVHCDLRAQTQQISAPDFEERGMSLVFRGVAETHVTILQTSSPGLRMEVASAVQKGNRDVLQLGDLDATKPKPGLITIIGSITIIWKLILEMVCSSCQSVAPPQSVSKSKLPEAGVAAHHGFHGVRVCSRSRRPTAGSSAADGPHVPCTYCLIVRAEGNLDDGSGTCRFEVEGVDLVLNDLLGVQGAAKEQILAAAHEFGRLAFQSGVHHEEPLKLHQAQACVPNAARPLSGTSAAGLSEATLLLYMSVHKAMASGRMLRLRILCEQADSAPCDDGFPLTRKDLTHKMELQELVHERVSLGLTAVRPQVHLVVRRIEAMDANSLAYRLLQQLVKPP